jgi:predicted transposase YdaD
METSNPHDRFAKTVMSNLDNAKDFFFGVLPPDLKRCLDLDALELDTDSYVDDDLAEFFSDIVYTCRCSGIF